MADIRADDAARPGVQAEIEVGEFVSLAEDRAKRKARRK